MSYRIWLSPPEIGDLEIKHTNQALNNQHLAYFGTQTEAFSQKLKNRSKSQELLLTNSGTSALHLALLALGVNKGDIVICQTNSFVAAANSILYVGAQPVFIDSELDTWNMCPLMLESCLKDLASRNKHPKAIITVDLYGMPCQYKEILEIAKSYRVPLIEDSAEALGSVYNSEPCGSIGVMGIYSFNANKIVTTSSGGALLSNTPDLIEKASYFANQAKSNTPNYWHEDLGYNYKFSNVLAGIGNAQMDRLDHFLERKHAIFNYYLEQLESIMGEVTYQKTPKHSYSNRWLSTFVFKNEKLREVIRIELLSNDIECRPLWTPLHLQPLYKRCLSYLNGNSENLFKSGLCLPSGTQLLDPELEEITSIISSCIS